MNDKELDQILRKSLRPEVSEEELEVWDRAPRMESEHTMRRHTIIKSTVAAAACLALVAGIGYGHFSDIGKSPAQPDTKMTKTTPQSVLNSFTVTVSAAEVKKNKAPAHRLRAKRRPGRHSRKYMRQRVRVMEVPGVGMKVEKRHRIGFLRRLAAQATISRVSHIRLIKAISQWLQKRIPNI